MFLCDENVLCDYLNSVEFCDDGNVIKKEKRNHQFLSIIANNVYTYEDGISEWNQRKCKNQSNTIYYWEGIINRMVIFRFEKYAIGNKIERKQNHSEPKFNIDCVPIWKFSERWNYVRETLTSWASKYERQRRKIIIEKLKISRIDHLNRKSFQFSANRIERK